MDDETRDKRRAYIRLAAADAGLEGDAFRDFLKRRTGKTDLDSLTDKELEDLKQWLKPSPAQWGKVRYFCDVMGWEGFDDPAFLAFVERVTKKNNPRFLTRLLIRNLIAALSSWIDTLDHHGRLPPATVAPDARLSPEPK
ncbi:hypothetical protein [uncultured Lamprocystis sp.]|jgi:hypothetical protein|uniref:hypothetical protein n=1 Tax=uncultured Lamprocystis sp. TaxID=543132 RepID=UPI0025EA6E63|nr:hypothetical protein [uncultured Lamprocystis sp.]